MDILRSISYVTNAVSTYQTVTRRIAAGIATLLLVVMFAFLFSTSLQESAAMDELAHIPAGYSYLTHQDMRLNPEHPPLIKDIAAFPLLFLHLNFPDTAWAWTNDLNGQWDMGRAFLYQSGNNPDVILFWARLGPIFVTLLFGILLYKFGKEWFGKCVALMALTLFVFSPAILANGKYVTTDIAAALGFFVGIGYFLRYLEKPTRWRLIIAGLAFGVAEALKFSLILLIPFLPAVAVLWIWAHHEANTRRVRMRELGTWMLRVIAIFAIGYIVIIWPLYQYHIWNFPASPANNEVRQMILDAQGKYCPTLDYSQATPNQFRDTVCNLKTFRPHALADVVAWMSEKPGLRPFAEYALGVMMVGARTVGGNTTYFLGEVSRNAWWYYFPVVYLIKAPLPLHVLTFLALIILYYYFKRRRANLAPDAPRFFERTGLFLREHFVPVVMAAFILFYWGVSMTANLNIGIRHIIPTLPFIYLLVSYIIIAYLRRKPDFKFEFSLTNAKKILSFYKQKILRWAVLIILLLWYIVVVIVQYPYFTAYFNELIGGPQNGYKYVADSNLDWGQDLKRLAQYMQQNNIDAIHLDYFGGGEPAYYLKDKYIAWGSSNGPVAGWVGVSATKLDSAIGTPIGDLTISDQDSYLWLRDKTPVAVIGHSIFLYHLN